MVKTPEQLLDLYYKSVGRNGTFLLNFPVDRDGLIHPVDSANAAKFHDMVCNDFKTDLVSGIVPKVSNERGGAFTASALTDDDYDTYWATQDSVISAEIEFNFSEPTQMNRLMLQEYIPLGQRVKAFSVEYKQGEEWLPIKTEEQTTTIGYKRLLRFDTVKTDALRIRITDARGPLCLNRIGLFFAE